MNLDILTSLFNMSTDSTGWLAEVREGFHTASSGYSRSGGRHRRSAAGHKRPVNRRRRRIGRVCLPDQGQSKANNNLAGATWENPILSEMSALATRCDTKNRDLRDELERMRAECQKLVGCK